MLHLRKRTRVEEEIDARELNKVRIDVRDRDVVKWMIVVVLDYHRQLHIIQILEIS